MIWEIVYNFENFMAQIKWMEGKRDIYILDANMLLFFYYSAPTTLISLYIQAISQTAHRLMQHSFVLFKILQFSRLLKLEIVYL